MNPNAAPDVAELVAAVRDLNNTAGINAVAVNELRAQSQRNTTSNRRHAIALWITAVSLAIDLVLSAALIRADRIRHCGEERSAAFFKAERSKVEGQVAGLREARNSNGDAVAALAGFDQFIASSQAYLDDIAAISHRSQHTPFWGC